MRKPDRLPRRHAYLGTWPSITAIAALLTLGSACKSSDSEVRPDGSTTGATGGSGGTGGNARAGTGGGPSGTGGGAGSTGTAGTTGGCAPRTAFTEAAHTVLQVKWAAGTATNAGTGVVHAWARTAWTGNGNSLSGTAKACGSVLPPAGLSSLVGGGMILIEFPNAAWDAPTMPTFTTTQTQSGWDIGSTASNSLAVMVGYTMANGSTADWPTSASGITTTVDADGDMKPGLTAAPRNGGGYVLPPTDAIGALLGGDRADKLYTVFRLIVTAMTTRTSCDQASGTATVMHFDNHVIGCHVSGKGECTSTQADFLDTNRTVFEVQSATIETKIVPEAATCADVRAALPM
jgi:hypothetical protein